MSRKTTQTQSFRTKNIKREMATKVSKASHYSSFPPKWLQASSKYSTHVRFSYMSFLLKLKIVKYISVRGFAWVCVGVRGYAWVCTDVGGYARICASVCRCVCGYAQVCACACTCVGLIFRISSGE